MSFADEYNLCITRVDTLTDRRQAITTTYLSVNSALIGVTAFLFKDGQLTGWPQQLAVITLLIAGIAACDLWRRLVQQYSILLQWWYEQLRELESTMGHKIVTKEYEELYSQRLGRQQIGMTRYETNLTWLFTLLYSAAAVAIFVAMVISFL